MSSCYYGSNTRAVNTLVGSHIGGTIGSVVGANTGGFAGEVFGNVLGTVAGAAVGNAVGKSVEKSVGQRQESAYAREYADDAPGIYTRPSSGSRYSAANTHRPSYNKSIDDSAALDILSNMKIKNLRFIDENRNRIINSNEKCTLIFDVYNGNDQTVYDMVPQIFEVSGMQHISIDSPAVIRKLAPGDKISYTIFIRTDKKLREGTATFSIELSDASGLSVPLREFDIKTAK